MMEQSIWICNKVLCRKVSKAMWGYYKGLNNNEVTFEKRDRFGNWIECDSEDEGAEEVERCGYCGCIITGYSCDCAGSKW